jgi:hypothetical protein
MYYIRTKKSPLEAGFFRTEGNSSDADATAGDAADFRTADAEIAELAVGKARKFVDGLAVLGVLAKLTGDCPEHDLVSCI